MTLQKIEVLRKINPINRINPIFRNKSNKKERDKLKSENSCPSCPLGGKSEKSPVFIEFLGDTGRDMGGHDRDIGDMRRGRERLPDRIKRAP